MNVSFCLYNIILGNCWPKSLLTKNLKLLISTYYKDNMVKLLQNKMQVPNKSKLQLAAKFIYYIYLNYW